MHDATAIPELTSQTVSIIAGISSIALLMPLLLALVAPLVNIFFSWSCYNTMKKIPFNQRNFPAWFCWLFVIPLVGLIFEWIMLPFGIPYSIRAVAPNDPVVIRKTNGLMGVGLAYCILSIFSVIPFAILILFLPLLILWIIYWVNVIKIRSC